MISKISNGMKHKTIKEKEKEVYEKMKDAFHYKNPMAAPRVKKVAISSGTGEKVKKDKGRNDLVLDRLSKITGQKGALRGAKQSIASFKIRKGDPVGVIATLRGDRMYAFLEKL